MQYIDRDGGFYCTIKNFKILTNTERVDELMSKMDNLDFLYSQADIDNQPSLVSNSNTRNLFSRVIWYFY